MAGIRISIEKCIGCGACEKSCTAGALSVKEDSRASGRTGKLAFVDQGLCTLCSTCLTGCRFGAISMEMEQADLSDWRGVLIICERSEEGFLPVAFELLGKGRELADQVKASLSALFITEEKDAIRRQQQAKELIGGGADCVIILPAEKNASLLEEPSAQAISRVINEVKPEIVLFGATMFGRNLAPSVAARLRTGLTADCTVLEIDEESGLLQQTRPAFGGNLMATIVCPKHRPQMATVRPGIMKAGVIDKTRTGRITEEEETIKIPEGLEVLSFTPQEKTESIRDAKIIIDCGRGVGNKKNLKLIKELCEKTGASLGCSRPLVDTGMCEYPHQVGQTGCTVAPDLLICLGVSGAIQHLAGISQAKKIIAVNTDPDAPVFKVAHVKIVGDCMEAVKEMLAKF